MSSCLTIGEKDVSASFFPKKNQKSCVCHKNPPPIQPGFFQHGFFFHRNSKFSHAIQNLPYGKIKNRIAVFFHAVFRHFLLAILPQCLKTALFLADWQQFRLTKRQRWVPSCQRRRGWQRKNGGGALREGGPPFFRLTGPALFAIRRHPALFTCLIV
jgi:hypothetical protein